MPDTSPSTQPIVLFTAFEPSGDALAAPVVAELLREVPGLAVYAYGGSQMEAAGARLIERTADDGAMGASSLQAAMRVRKQIAGLKRWAAEHRVVLHVPVDSPAANFPICKFLRRGGTRTVHLVAPQLWAWGSSRIGKLRRCTDLVLCLLPFEEQWFNDRDVPTRFIGHPVINRPLPKDLDQYVHDLPQGAPRVLLLPGSRTHEVKANIRLLSAAYAELKNRYTGMAGVIVVSRPDLAKIVRRKVKTFPGGLHMVTTTPEAAIRWCDLALAVSGTVTLQVARQCRPMVGVYKTGILSWLAAKVILRTPLRLLPNIIAEREIVPEFVPHPFGAGPIVTEANRFLQDSKQAAIISEQLKRVCLRFANKKPAEEAAVYLLKIMKQGVV